MKNNFQMAGIFPYNAKRRNQVPVLGNTPKSSNGAGMTRFTSRFSRSLEIELASLLAPQNRK
jgi:hypothetical protein